MFIVGSIGITACLEALPKNGVSGEFYSMIFIGSGEDISSSSLSSWEAFYPVDLTEKITLEIACSCVKVTGVFNSNLLTRTSCSLMSIRSVFNCLLLGVFSTIGIITPSTGTLLEFLEVIDV